MSTSERSQPPTERQRAERAPRRPSTTFSMEDLLPGSSQKQNAKCAVPPSAPILAIRPVASAPRGYPPARPASTVNNASYSSTPEQVAWGRAASRLVIGSDSNNSNGSMNDIVPATKPVQHIFSDSEDDSSSDGNDGDHPGIQALEDEIFKRYVGTSDRNGDNSNESELLKIKEQLLAAHSGAARCLICLERIKGSDPVWDCKDGCHVIVHLICIQSWARQGINRTAESPDGATWHCPKCRTDYLANQLPREYRCFCSKTVQPEFNPWLAPHTCGEVCNRKLPGSCDHQCTLLCHPGPCPPCPQLVRAPCHCGKETDLMRCGGRAQFSCALPCGRKLSCGVHRCNASCHPGECPPCQERSLFSCRCGLAREERSCSDRDFECGRTCNSWHPCGKHKCQRVCHAGDCGECPSAGTRSCPCGKVKYADLACDRSAPNCGGTCEKALPCGRHTCQQRCHQGSCSDTCRIVIAKRCRCGGVRKEVPCSSELLCERRCVKIRQCGRHACKRRCCDGATCPPCTEICGKKLRCGNHKCPAPCHSGPCSPCPITVRISCACSATAFTVPCGAEKQQKPPRCSRRCQVAPTCGHGSEAKPHRCHYGGCPPCDLPCAKVFECGHCCPQKCHGPRPVAMPEYSLRVSKKQKRQQQAAADVALSSQGTLCLPCVEPVVRTCLGRHPGSERVMPCSSDPLFACSRLCGCQLACGNHTCSRPCHVISAASSCLQCNVRCQKPRDPPCKHPCIEKCHPGPCQPCTALVKRACHCGALVHALNCCDWTATSPDKRILLLQCGGPCHKKLPFCSHLCPEMCHPGPCPSPAECRKKVSVRCSCQRIKKEWPCSQVQAVEKGQGRTSQKLPLGIGLLVCDDVCESIQQKKREAERLAMELEMEALQQKAAWSSKEERVASQRRRKRHGSSTKDESKEKSLVSIVIKWTFRILILLALIFMAALFLSLLWRLSHYLNVREARRRVVRNRQRHDRQRFQH